MCSIGVSNREWLPLEEVHKGQMHEYKKWVQETRMEGVECFV